MTLFQAILLGAVQGLTEFLPISSSGHLVLVPAVFGWGDAGIAFDVLLHAGTLIAVVVYFRADLWSMTKAFFTNDPDLAQDRRLAWLIVIATVPTVLIALAFGDLFESFFEQVAWVGVFMLVTAGALTAAELLSRRDIHEEADLTWWKAALIGVAQGAAIAPGVSRSGATIAAGMGAGLDRERAARFSFLMSVPVILAATARSALAVGGGAPFPDPLIALAGFVTAALVGYLAIAVLLAYLKVGSLYVFAAYTAFVGTVVLVWQYVA
jgi:undecaprenyl-diphosphatase